MAGIRRGILRLSAVALVLLVAASWFGWRWDAAEEAAFREADLTPPGEMVRAGTGDLHVVTSGSAGPGVLLISGLGDDLRTWNEIQERLSEYGRIVSYDRPGLGWSPARDDAATLDAMVEDVRLLVSHEGLFDSRPILVGHSLGGAVARRFAHRHPGDAAGLVLLDPTPTNAMPTFAKVVTGVLYTVTSWSGSVGLSRARLYRRYPDATREQQLAWGHLYASGARARSVRREYQGAESSDPLPLIEGGLGDLPLTILSAPAVGPPGLGSVARRIDEGKRQMATESRRGRFVEVQTGHYVHYDDPDRVVAEVLALMESLSSQR